MEIVTLRDEAALRDAWLRNRLDVIVPRLMEREGIDAWVLAAREYNEDPVVETMLPATWMAARRRTILLFTDRGGTRAAVSRYAVGDAFPAVWDPDSEPDQWGAVAALLDAADPASIAVNRSPGCALADGMSAAEYDALTTALPGRLRERLVPGESLAIGWLETRSPGEMERYPEACRIGHDIIAEGLSSSVISPGSTTTEDLEWWFRERVRALGLVVWFQPTVSVQRPGGDARSDFSDHPEPVVIEAGDLIHLDFGIVYLGLHTDQQQHAYVLRPGETAPPAGLQAALRIGNGLQDLLLAEFAPGRTGNEILASVRAAAIDAGIRPRIYSHPIGFHGHAAGPTIGLWDSQDGVPGAGDYPVHPDTAYSIELGVRVDVPEWGGQTVSIMLEEEAFFDGREIDWIAGRQEELLLVG
jgi:Xaa-Pro aminopeptidase